MIAESLYQLTPRDVQQAQREVVLFDSGQQSIGSTDTLSFGTCRVPQDRYLLVHCLSVFFGNPDAAGTKPRGVAIECYDPNPTPGFGPPAGSFPIYRLGAAIQDPLLPGAQSILQVNVYPAHMILPPLLIIRGFGQILPAAEVQGRLWIHGELIPRGSLGRGSLDLP